MRTGQHFAYQAAVPGPNHQLGFGDGRRRSIANNGNEFVNIGQRDCQAFQHMTAFARLTQREYCAARHHFAAVGNKYLYQVLQVAQFRLAVDQRHHVDAESVLQLGLFEEVIQNHFGHFAALEFNDQAHAGLVALVLNMTDALNFLLMNQFGHALLKRFFIDLIRQFVNDDRLPLTLVDVLEVAFGPHHHPAASGAVAVLDAVDAVDNASRGEVRRQNNFHQFVDRSVGVLQ